jgi:hypothetical protein
VAENNIIRLQPTSSYGNIKVLDGTLITNFLAYDVNASDVTVELESTERFPTAGYPYTVRVGEGTTSVEDLSVSNNNTSNAVLSVTSLVNNHDIGARVSMVSGAADTSISTGIQAQVPATGDGSPIVFTTVEGGTIVNGDYESTPIAAKAVVPGLEGNVGTGAVSQFAASPPLTGALVTNEGLFTGGREVESDSDLRDRALDSLASLSRGTPLALKNAVLGTTDPLTGQRITTANVLEKFSTDEVIIYVDDGSGFVPDSVTLARDAVSGAYASPTSSMTLSDSSEFPSEGYVLLSPESAQAEVVGWTSVDYASDTLSLASNTVNTHDDADEAVQVEVITSSSEGGTLFYDLSKWPLVRNSNRLWIGPSASNLTLMVEGTDYYLNKARGRIELLSAVAAGSFIAMTYSYYVGLIFYAQRFVNGSSGDETAFPGVVAAGIEATVETPAIRRITVRLSISALPGFDELTLAPQVQSTIESYITALGIGEDVIVSEIIERAMGVPGIYNVLVQEPTSDLAVSTNELPVPTNSTGTSLVTVA